MEQCLYPKMKDKKNEKLYRTSRSFGRDSQRVKTEAQIGLQIDNDLRSVLVTAAAFLPQGIANI